MSKDKVAFLGPISSFSHQAVMGCFSESEYEYVPMVTFRDIFEALQAGRVSRGVVPFENSTNGPVVFTLDLLADRSNSFPDVKVCGETYLGIHHYLLGHNEDQINSTKSLDISRITAPEPQSPQVGTRVLADVKHIGKIFSHPQVFGQCEIFLSAYLRGIERIDVSSTSKAAELVKADESGKSVAIASNAAAELHGLRVLAERIEDDGDNTTRFFILRAGTNGIEGNTSSDSKRQLAKPSKTLVSFTVDHKSPGALADVLDCFKRHKLNLTSINSRPSRITPFQYIFFVEFEGSKFNDPEQSVNKACNSLGQVASSWRWLGSWEDELRI